MRRHSRRFKIALAEANIEKQNKESIAAWETMVQLFEILRGEEDSANLASELMQAPTGYLVLCISTEDQHAMMEQKKIDRARSTVIGLREALNKIAHWKGTNFRVDGRGAHYILLSGTQREKKWVAEIHIPKLCKNCSAAIAGITG
ncbi:hypothetical protein GIW33_27970 [Pseudomonas syringae]|nr:hypothetical protein [Pseudomonas syringae]